MLFPGKEVFELKATYGLPLEVIVGEIFDKKLVIEWPGFIEQARANGWWDFKTIDTIKYALEDVDCTKQMKEEILVRCKIYVTKYPHPKMRGN